MSALPAAYTAIVGERLDARARELAAFGGSQEQIAAQLEAEMPGFRLTEGPEWRRDAPYMNPAANAVMERARREALAHEAHEPEVSARAFVPMSTQLLAFAEVRGWRCDHCGRVGSRASDPDGAAWRKDLIPGTARQVLSCSGCVGGARGDDGL